MADFVHYILTRFNVSLYSGASIDIEAREILDKDKWMEHRFELFDTFCFPSIKGQANQNFQWLVVFDARTPEKFRSRIEGYRAEFDRFMPVFTDVGFAHSGLPRHASNLIIRDMPAEIEYVITTRLDCDDALHISAVDAIQKNFHFQKYKPLNLMHGYFYDLAADAVYKAKYDTNPFISLFEKVRYGRVQTAWARSHGEWLQRKTVQDGRYWIVVIHGANLCNRAFGEIAQEGIGAIAGEFSLDHEKVKKTAARFAATYGASAGAEGGTNFIGSNPVGYSFLRRVYYSRYISFFRIFLKYSLFKRS